MDISRQLPNNISKTPGEYEAVAVLHKALVSLREELSKRDTQIKLLEGKLLEAEEGLKLFIFWLIQLNSGDLIF